MKRLDYQLPVTVLNGFTVDYCYCIDDSGLAGERFVIVFTNGMQLMFYEHDGGLFAMFGKVTG